MARPIDLPPNVVQAGYGKRFFAYLIDIVVIGLAIVSVYFLLSQKVVLPAVGYYDRVNEKDAFMTSSHVTDTQENNWGRLQYEVQESGEYGYQKYANRIWYYCTSFLPQHSEMQMNPSGYKLSNGEQYLEFLGNRKDAANVGKWTWANFFEPTRMYEPAKDNQGNPDYTKIPQLTEWHQKWATPAAIIKAFHNPDTLVGAYDDVYNHLYAQTALTHYNDAISHAQWLAYIPAVTIPPIIFNFFVPLFFPKGKTFGKLFLGLAVSTEDGFVAKKGKVALRYGIITMSYAMLILRNYWIAFFGLQVIWLLIFITVALSGTGQGLHDIFAGTIVVDEKKSKIFRTEEGRQRYIENHPDSEVADWNREKTAEQFMEQYGDRREDD